jgi:hypothetical protein
MCLCPCPLPSLVFNTPQYRHYEACLAIFQLNPSQDSREFGEFITFIAQVGASRGRVADVVTEK